MVDGDARWVTTVRQSIFPRDAPDLFQQNADDQIFVSVGILTSTYWVSCLELRCWNWKLKCLLLFVHYASHDDLPHFCGTCTVEPASCNEAWDIEDRSNMTQSTAL